MPKPSGQPWIICFDWRQAQEIHPGHYHNSSPGGLLMMSSNSASVKRGASAEQNGADNGLARV
ncbi:MAG TPA: hypothetical protein VEW46_06685 [Pyrinomonadaceae bacterium]|nr:hypothetical protein [Pyrinomonadaceae bacterium]